MLHCHMLKEHRESYTANIRHSTTVAVSMRYHRTRSHLLLNFASASKANKFLNYIIPSFPLRVVCKSNATWPAFSVHTDDSSRSARTDRKHLRCLMGKQLTLQPSKSQPEAALIRRRLRGMTLGIRGPCRLQQLWDCSFFRLQNEALLGWRTMWLNHFGNRLESQLWWRQ